MFQRKKQNSYQVRENAMGKSREKKKKKQLGSWDGKCSVRPLLFNAMDSALHFAALMQHRMRKKNLDLFWILRKPISKLLLWAIV